MASRSVEIIVILCLRLCFVIPNKKRDKKFEEGDERYDPSVQSFEDKVGFILFLLKIELMRILSRPTTKISTSDMSPERVGVQLKYLRKNVACGCGGEYEGFRLM